MITVTSSNSFAPHHYPYHAFKLFRRGVLYIGDWAFKPVEDSNVVLKLLQFASRGIEVEIKC